MNEWIDPRYADVVERYWATRWAASPRRRQRGWSARSRRPYGDPFVIVIDTATGISYTAGRGRTDT